MAWVKIIQKPVGSVFPNSVYPWVNSHRYRTPIVSRGKWSPNGGFSISVFINWRVETSITCTCCGFDSNIGQTCLNIIRVQYVFVVGTHHLIFWLVGGEAFDTVHHHTNHDSPMWAHTGPKKVSIDPIQSQEDEQSADRRRRKAGWVAVVSKCGGSSHQWNWFFCSGTKTGDLLGYGIYGSWTKVPGRDCTRGWLLLLQDWK